MAHDYFLIRTWSWLDIIWLPINDPPPAARRAPPASVVKITSLVTVNQIMILLYYQHFIFNFPSYFESSIQTIFLKLQVH